MKKKFLVLSFFAFLILGSSTLTSCNRKSGCPINDPKNTHVKTNKKGDFKAGKSKSGLLPKKMRKKG